jgi:hypothetical protein
MGGGKMMDDKTDTANRTGMGDESGSDTGSSGETIDTAPASTTKPRTGQVTADENNRFLAEIVALHSLSKASDEIAKSIADAGEGGILIVNELDFAADEIFI